MDRLEQFVARNLIPEVRLLRLCSSSRDPAGAELSRSAVIELFLWLHVGTELGAFSLGQSRQVYATHLHPFFESLISSDSDERQNMRNNHIYVAHSAESLSLVRQFPRFVDVLIEKGMRGEDVFLSELAGFQTPPNRLIPAFQTLLLLSSDLALDRTVREFTRQVSFAGNDEWRRNWEPNCDWKELLAAQYEGRSDASTTARTLTGFLKLWGYAAKMKEFFANLEGHASVSRTPDTFLLRDRVRAMQRWRINLGSRETSQRFEQIRERVYQGMESDARNVSTQVVQMIQESMGTAFEFWFDVRPALSPVFA